MRDKVALEVEQIAALPPGLTARRRGRATIAQTTDETESAGAEGRPAAVGPTALTLCVSYYICKTTHDMLELLDLDLSLAQ